MRFILSDAKAVCIVIDTPNVIVQPNALINCNVTLIWGLKEKVPSVVASELRDPGAGALACLSTFVPLEALRVAATAD